MSDFLARLGERACGTATSVVPVAAPLFARRDPGPSTSLFTREQGDAGRGFDDSSSAVDRAPVPARHVDDGQDAPTGTPDPWTTRDARPPADGRLVPSALALAMKTGPRAQGVVSRDAVAGIHHDDSARDNRAALEGPAPRVHLMDRAAERDAGIEQASTRGAALRHDRARGQAADARPGIPTDSTIERGDARPRQPASLERSRDTEQEIERVLLRLRGLGGAIDAPRNGAGSTVAPPVVRISIGRIEVRAAPTPAPATPSQPRSQPAPMDSGPSLADYLAKRPRVMP